MNTAILVTEIVANEGTSCAFLGEEDTLAVARLSDDGQWSLRLSAGSEHRCRDFDEMRELVRTLVPGGNACFERRRIISRRLHRSRLLARERQGEAEQVALPVTSG